MSKSISRTILGLNIVGGLCGIGAACSLAVFFIAGEGEDSYYFLGSFFTALIAAILSFGFSHIIGLLADLRDVLHRKD